MIDYNEIYDEFIESYRNGTVDPRAAGEAVGQLVQSFSELNALLAQTEVKYNRALAVVMEQKEEGGKAMTAAKGQIMAEAGKEYEEYVTVKRHREACEQCIGAMKVIQWGLTGEMRMGSGT